MEIAIIVTLLVLVALWFGIFRPLETGAKSLDREVSHLSNKRKVQIINESAKFELKDADVKTAKKNIAALDEIEL